MTASGRRFMSQSDVWFDRISSLILTLASLVFAARIPYLFATEKWIEATCTLFTFVIVFPPALYFTASAFARCPRWNDRPISESTLVEDHGDHICIRVPYGLPWRVDRLPRFMARRLMARAAVDRLRSQVHDEDHRAPALS